MHLSDKIKCGICGRVDYVDYGQKYKGQPYRGVTHCERCLYRIPPSKRKKHKEV